MVGGFCWLQGKLATLWEFHQDTILGGLRTGQSVLKLGFIAVSLGVTYRCHHLQCYHCDQMFIGTMPAVFRTVLMMMMIIF